MKASSRQYRSRLPLGIRAINALGKLAAPVWGTPRVDVEKAVALSKQRAGFTDFGDPFFIDPLNRYIDSVNEEGRLTPFGTWFTQRNLLIQLSNRLCINRYCQQFPDFADQPINQPLIIVGLPRTGTTLLYNLLALDPGARSLKMHEAFYPAPLRAKSKRDPRRRRTRLVVRAMNHWAPELRKIHPLDADAPEECSRMLANTFLSSYLVMENRCPSYIEWFHQLAPELREMAIKDLKRQLKVVAHQSPPKAHWLLKSPALVHHVSTVLDVFPDAYIIQTNRRPSEVIPSTCSLCATYRSVASDSVDTHELGREVLQLSVYGAQCSAEARTQYGDSRFADVDFRSLVSDPIGVIERIYEQFQMPLTDALRVAMQKYLKENPRHKHGRHAYSAQQFGLTEEQIDAAFLEFKQVPSGTVPE